MTIEEWLNKLGYQSVLHNFNEQKKYKVEEVFYLIALGEEAVKSRYKIEQLSIRMKLLLNLEISKNFFCNNLKLSSTYLN
jgi:hypothetical protein